MGITLVVILIFNLFIFPKMEKIKWSQSFSNFAAPSTIYDHHKVVYLSLSLIFDYTTDNFSMIVEDDPNVCQYITKKSLYIPVELLTTLILLIFIITCVVVQHQCKRCVIVCLQINRCPESIFLSMLCRKTIKVSIIYVCSQISN